MENKKPKRSIAIDEDNLKRVIRFQKNLPIQPTLKGLVNHLINVGLNTLVEKQAKEINAQNK